MTWRCEVRVVISDSPGGRTGKSVDGPFDPSDLSRLVSSR